LETLTAALLALRVEMSERAHRDNARIRVEKLDPAQSDPKELEKEIGELVKAADDLMWITSADTSTSRLLLSRLLSQVQGRFYEASGGDGS